MAVGRGFRRLWRIFRAPPGFPGVERQFLEPSPCQLDFDDVDIRAFRAVSEQQQQNMIFFFQNRTMKKWKMEK